MKRILWGGITILLSVVIILVCTFLPSMLWNMTYPSIQIAESIPLSLPEAETVISSEEASGTPSFFPSVFLQTQYPDAKYSITAITNTEYESMEVQGTIAQFSKLVRDAVLEYFDIFCTDTIIAQYTNVWNVSLAEGANFVDYYCSCTVILQQEHILWKVTAYGYANVLTYLRRTPYSDSTDYTYALSDALNAFNYNSTDSDSVEENILPNILTKFLKNSASYFDVALSADLERIWEKENYFFSAEEDNIYEIFVWSDTYEATYFIELYIQGTEKCYYVRTLTVKRIE